MASTNRWNMIGVDWSPLSQSSFTDAFYHTNSAGDKLGNFTAFLVKSGAASFNSIHYIGHGLGALVADHAAKNIQMKTRKMIARITGLDPAITLLGKKRGLNQQHEVLKAKFVDVIHTNGGEFGTMQPLGHVDYYPNGGKRQPGCGSSMCSHTRACEYWIASIKNVHAFKAFNYKFWNDYLHKKFYKILTYPMGIVANPTIPYGSYFLETLDEAPHVYTKHKLIRK